jgi:hypothetical protein
MGMEGPGSMPPPQINPEELENSEDITKIEELQIPQHIPTVETTEDVTAKQEEENTDVARLEEIRLSLGMPPSEEASEPTEQSTETPTELTVQEKKEESETEESSVDKDIEIDPSLKRKGFDFTDSLNRVSSKLSNIDREVEIVSPGTISKFRSATRNLESAFREPKLDLNQAISSFNRLTTSFEDLSLIKDQELRKIQEDSRKSLVSAIEGSKDSAMALRKEESMDELRRNINKMIDKADAATFRLRRWSR